MTEFNNIKNNYDVIIIGGGIIGAATARELSKYKLDVCILEANNHVAGETSEGNSGVIHVGFDAVPGTLKAEFNIKGRLLWFNEIFPDIKIRKAKVPSLVIAVKHHISKQLETIGSYEDIDLKDEVEHLKLLYKRGLDNGLDPSEMQLLDRKQTLRIEPNVNPLVMGALYAPNSWVINGPEATYALMAVALKNGVKLMLKNKVVNIEVTKDGFIIKTNQLTKLASKVVIDAAGHYADTMANLAGVDDFKQTTRRGEYRVLAKSESKYVNNIIFKTPTIFGKGVIVAPMLTGHVLVGPTALNGVPKHDTRLVTREMYDHIGDIGNDIVPSLRLDKTVKTFAGSRPICVATNDFVVRTSKKNKRFIILGGMQSPALSSAPAIAKRAVALIKESGVILKLNKDFYPKYEPPLPIVI